MFKGDYLEALAQHLGLEFIYTLATLKHRGSQRYFESMGYQLIGFVPGCDREEISPGRNQTGHRGRVLQGTGASRVFAAAEPGRHDATSQSAVREDLSARVAGECRLILASLTPCVSERPL